jgi:hypothetical protein
MISRGMFLMILFSFSMIALVACSPLMLPANTRTPVIPPPDHAVASPTVIIEPVTSIPTISPVPPEELTSNAPGDVFIPLPTNPYQPRPGDERFARGSVFIETADLLVRESYPPQYAVVIKGNLPTPCHAVRAEVKPTEMSKQIKISVFSLVDPEKICVQVLAKFEMTISLGSFPTGNYEVLVNDVVIGQINAP